MSANMIESGDVSFLCGEETLADWKATVYFGRKRMMFGGGGDSVELLKGSHLGMRLELMKNGVRRELKGGQPGGIQDGGPGCQGRTGGDG